MKYLIYLSLFILMTAQANAQQGVTRKDLLTAMTSAEKVAQVDVKEITMGPGQHAPLHQHPCPVVGYVAEGTLLYQIKGQPAQTLQKGAAFYEPANTAIARFDNASDKEPLKFVAFYLNNGELPLIEMIEDTNDKH